MDQKGIIQQEIIIDIHMKHLKMKVDKRTPLRVIWSRGKKQAKTQVKYLDALIDVAVFDEKFQINTVLELDKETNMPVKQKMSKMTVCLDKSLGGQQLGQVEFDMVNFSYGEYNKIKLYLKKDEDNQEYPFDEEETYIDIGLKGTRADGLVQRRMSAIKDQMNDSLKDLLKDQKGSGKKSADQLKAMLQGTQSQDVFQNIINIEVDKLKKDAKDKKKLYEKKLTEKTSKINDLLTDIQNASTEVQSYTGDKTKLNIENDQIKERMMDLQKQVEVQTNLIDELENLSEQKQKALLVKDTRIKQLQSRTQNGGSDNNIEIQLRNMYSFESFDVNFNRDIHVLQTLKS